MLHAKIINSSIEKIEISRAENFLKSEKFGAVIYFIGVVRDNNENKKVFYPNVWFGPTLPHNTDDLFPKDWMKIYW